MSDSNSAGKMEIDSTEAQDEHRWTVIPGFPEYEASILGFVRNKHRKNLLTPRYNKAGKASVGVTIARKLWTKQVHVLVMATFSPCPDPNAGLVINHHDGNAKNNALDNLRWVSQSEASKISWSKRQGKARQHLGRSCQQLDLNTGAVIATFDRVTDAEKATGVDERAISVCLHGRKPEMGGFGWRYTTIENLDGERWREHEESGLKVSSCQRAIEPSKNKLLPPTNTQEGYVLVYSKKLKKQIPLHRLVADCFVSNPDPARFKVVDHKNGDRGNNSPENLRWTDLTGNNVYSQGKPVRDTTSGVVYMTLKEASEASGMQPYSISQSIGRTARFRFADGGRQSHQTYRVLDTESGTVYESAQDAELATNVRCDQIGWSCKTEVWRWEFVEK